MKIYGFDWDSGNWPKCGKHGVDKHEIEAEKRGIPYQRFMRELLDRGMQNLELS